jgi:hypothetical protein
MIGYLGARPQTPRVGFAELWILCSLLRFLLLFLEKKIIIELICRAEPSLSFLLSLLKKGDSTRAVGYLGACPQTPWVGFAEFWTLCSLLRFLLLFLEKEEHRQTHLQSRTKLLLPSLSLKQKG